MQWTPPGPAWLFCPADRPERYTKAAACADVVIIDLEDAVAPADKAEARRALVSNPLDPQRTIVRVNAYGTADLAEDLIALADTAYDVVMLPKCEGREQVESLSPRLVVALVESPRGAIAVAESLGAGNAAGVMWGAEDLVSALGGSSSRFANGTYRHFARHVRSQSLLAAKAHGLFALDSVYLDIADREGLAEESDDAVAIGFDGKVAIHPSQVPIIRSAYTPSKEQNDWAERLLEAVEVNRGVFNFEGQMVDAPVVAQAVQIRRRAAAAAQGV
ncbi:HpcH/HpaI aldolase/citrate lyase family protein [Gordonia terrae]